MLTMNGGYICANRNEVSCGIAGHQKEGAGISIREVGAIVQIRVKTGAVAEFSVQRVLTCISKRYWRQITMPVALAAVWQVAPPDTFLCWAELPLFSIIGRMVRNWLVLDLPNMRIRTH